MKVAIKLAKSETLYILSGIFFLMLQLPVVAQVTCNNIYQDIRNNLMSDTANINSQFTQQHDTLFFSLDPIVNYSKLPFATGTTELKRISDGAAYIVTFEYLVSSQIKDTSQRLQFGSSIKSAKEKLCDNLGKANINSEEVRQKIRGILSLGVSQYAIANKYFLVEQESFRSASPIKVKFISNPPGARIQYIINRYDILTPKDIPEELWTDANDGDVKDMLESSLYLIRYRWGSNEAWKQKTEEIDKTGEITVVQIVKEPKTNTEKEEKKDRKEKKK
jgi:hypothetical protein